MKYKGLEYYFEMNEKFYHIIPKSASKEELEILDKHLASKVVKKEVKKPTPKKK